MAVMSLGRVFAWLAEQDPDRIAVRDTDTALTRRELDLRTNALARLLQAHGVGVDDVVTIGLPSTSLFVEVCAAVWKAGAVPQALDPVMDADELLQIIELTAPALVIGFDDVPLEKRLQAHELDASGYDDAPLPDVHAASWKAPVSGGSTGRPKIIFSGTPATVDPERPTASYIPAQAVQLAAAPLHHSAPFLFAMRGLFVGHTLVLLERFDARAALEAVATHRVTWAVLSPVTMAAITDLGDERATYDVSSLERILHVGVHCPQWLKRDWIAWLGAERVDEIYAGTESIGITMIGGSDWLEHPGSVGRPVGGSRFRVLDADGREVPAGVVGEVFMQPRGGPGSTYRYQGADARSVDGYESLGDAGWLDEDGFLYLADRVSDVIRTSTATVYPARVEAALAAHPAVRSCVVVGLPIVHGTEDDSAGTEEVHALVDVGDGSLRPQDVLTWAAEQLPVDHVPSSVEIVHEQLRNAAGKARRSELRRRAIARRD